MKGITITENKDEIFNKIIDLDFAFAGADKQQFLQLLANPPTNPDQTAILNYFYMQDNIIILANIGSYYMIQAKDIDTLHKYCARVMAENPAKELHQQIVKRINKHIIKIQLHTPERMN